jgi:hypothetical protein
MMAPAAPNTVLSHVPAILRRLSESSHPVALIPPALSQLLGPTVSRARLEAALALLGFAETAAVADGLDGFRRDLETCAADARGLSLLTTACPPVESMIRRGFPELVSSLAAIVPPAERVAASCREAHPEATIFFLSPCSARARSLIPPFGCPGPGTNPAADYAIPLDIFYPTLLAAIAATGKGIENHSIPADPDCAESPCVTTSSMASLVVAGSEEIRAYLEDRGSEGLESDTNSASRVRIVELLACLGGCSRGDWAPKSGTAISPEA